MKALVPVTAALIALGAATAWWVGRGAPPPGAVSSPAGDNAQRLARLEERVERLERARVQLVLPAAAGAATVDPRARRPVAGGEDEDAEALARRVAVLEARLAELERPAQAEGGDDPLLARALSAAIERGDVAELLRRLQAGADPDARDDDRRTPLAVASAAGRLDMLALLLEHGADLERSSGRRRMTPLLAALDAGQEGAALLLLDRGADPRAVDKNGESALIWASFNGAAEAVDALVAAGVELDHRSHWGGTALASAAKKGELGVARALLEAGADPNLADDSGHTPLSIASAEGHGELAELLRAFGAH